ncbi:MAG: Fe-S protein assembly co-chaperone HscB, partial [Enterobacteriaceae bacterium]
FHPDRFAVAPEREKRLSLLQATAINDAYQILSHPLDRAAYLLSLKGIELNDEQVTLKDPDFLMQQLMLREELDEIERQSDPVTALLAFSGRVDKMTHAYTEQLQQQLASGDWSQAADSIRKLRFLDKLARQAEHLEQKLLDL